MTLTNAKQWTPRLLASVVGAFLLVLTPLAAKAEVTEAQQDVDQVPQVLETNNQSSNSEQASEVKILTPTANTVLEKRSSSVIVQYPLGASIELRLNGKPVDPALIGRTETDNEKQIVTQTWYGVVFQNGENILTAQEITNSVPGAETAVKVMVRGVPETLELETVEARIPADGRSSATVRGQFLDANGNRANWDTVVTLNASAGEFIGTDLKPDQSGFQVESKQGEFSATLRSGLEAQTVRIRAQAMKLEAFTSISV